MFLSRGIIWNTISNKTVYTEVCYYAGMYLPIAERRQIENEMIFRRMNEKVGDSLDELDAQNIDEGHPELIRTKDFLLTFKCECSDENCSERIALTISKYNKIHHNRDSFIVKPQHQVDPIEKVVESNKKYLVVKKNNSTAEPSDTLNETTINNS